MKQSFSDDIVFVEGSTIARHHIKRRLIKNGLVKYECARCHSNGDWEGEKLSLHLDHINGVSNDNRLSNLRFLCPNCHSLTDTYAGKNSKGLRTFGKPNFKAEKILSDRLKWAAAKNDPSLRLDEPGWRTRLGQALNISPQKVNQWLSRVDSKACGSLV